MTYKSCKSSVNLCNYAFEGSITNLGYDEHCEGDQIELDFKTSMNSSNESMSFAAKTNQA